MAKERVFIVISHKNSLKSKNKDDWQIEETVEFVNTLTNKHYTMSSAIADYINRKMITGSRFEVTDYDKFEDYIRTKYKDQLTQLDSVYRTKQVNTPALEPIADLVSDEFGNMRAKTVFDKV